jgi:hypothetical protein
MDNLFVIHGYEFIANRDSAPSDEKLDSLLVPSLEGKAATTEFVILRRKKPGTQGAPRDFTMRDLYPAETGAPILEVLVDRGGCGELVFRWLDCLIVPETGETRRENLADFRSATSAEEAVLAVYFGSVDACVVSKEACSEVMRYNPNGLSAKLEVVRTSPAFLKYVIACPDSMEKARRVALVKDSAGTHQLAGAEDWFLTPPKKDDFKTLDKLQADWNRYVGTKTEKPKPGLKLLPAPAAPPSVRPSAPAVPPVSAARHPERRPLE